MGACMSCSPSVSAAEADGGCGGLASAAVSSSGRIASRSWKERREKKKKKEKEKRRNGGGSDSDQQLKVGPDGGRGEAPCEDELHRVPCRMFLNSASEVACLFSQQGKKGTNQDAMLVWENFASRSDTVFCGVFDGHGPLGHLVSKKVRDSLPIKLYSHFRESTNIEDASISMDDEYTKSIEANDKGNLPDMYLTLKQYFLESFKSMDKELKFHPTIDCFCSGSTAVIAIKQGQDLVIGNVGDSRAVLGMRDKNNNLIAVQLTVDLKPNLPREAARIQQCRGRVFSLQDEPEVARVWLPNSDSPGLAMARAFGDFCLKDYGLISVPDISYRRLTDKDEFIVLASDGIWDVLSNKEVVDIVASAPTRATTARALVDCAVRAWRLKFPTSKIDDCAVVCLFFDNTNSTSSSNSSVAYLKEQANIDSTASITNVSIDMTDDEKRSTSQSTRSLGDCISVGEEVEWSALQGISRVNSLVRLPRFPFT
ncbi:putative protein phosphatase 2C 6 [Apostasia shenzhenica]|uniref:protein-serine/threonine phosphatase n=1 Tax=Apostasia shenzhenica TaxID=1088818 RepID=A0A2I0B3N9_9ASPA|nr:putative protein phosphatase 2C 6 [Apostasia shenzhenica]